MEEEEEEEEDMDLPILQLQPLLLSPNHQQLLISSYGISQDIKRVLEGRMSSSDTCASIPPQES
jgi:hypothetical protein